MTQIELINKKTFCSYSIIFKYDYSLKPLEVIYVSVRPKWLPRSISNIIIAGVYYPGSSPKYAPTQASHTTLKRKSIIYCYSKYEDPLILLMGDFNDLVRRIS